MKKKELIQFYNQEGKYLISLLRSVLRQEEPAPAPEGLRWEPLFALAKAHMIEATVYPAVVKTQACPPVILEKWQQEANAALRKELLFDGARQEIFKAFDEEKIDYMPLKGILIKDFYPQKGMRQFADNDILYRESDHKKVDAIMKRLNYTNKGFEFAHDVYMKAPVFNFELHRALFENMYTQYDYFNNPWDRAVKSAGDNCAWYMAKEDFYVYVLAHFRKHYLERGAGLRSFADLYYMRKSLSLNKEYVDSLLTQFDMLNFEKEALYMTDCFFGDNPQDVLENTLIYILSSGAHGTENNALDNRKAKEGRLKFLITTLFPPYKEMKSRHSILKTLPFLLPFFWIGRFFTAIFSKKRWARLGGAITNLFTKKK